MSTPELGAALETIFQRRVMDLRRILCPYSSSFTIEELHVTFENAETMTTIFKNLNADAMLEAARQAKPDFLYAPEREIQVYRALLSQLNSGAPQFYGAAVEPALQRYWLFLEKVPGCELYTIGEFETWLIVSRWLASFHSSCAANIPRSLAPHLLEHDATYYWRWLQRAHESSGSILDEIAAKYYRVINVLLDLPRTLIHGEFYASNIIVQEQVKGLRVCPVDWEMAAIGPGLLDVAALTSGKWSREERFRMLEAYQSLVAQPLHSQDLITAFECCRLQIALQWLGWSQAWSPPQAHAHDWLAEALRISAEAPLASLFE